MIKVYAISPEAVFDPKIQQALESFGFHHGRLIGRVPKEWQKEVSNIYYSKFPQDKRMEIALERLYKKRVVKKIPLVEVESKNWVDRASATNPEDVQAIICLQIDPASGTDSRMLGRDDLHDENPIWQIETGVRKHRTAMEMAECVRVLLRYSAVVKFIDPYFSGEPRHMKFVDQCVSVMCAETHGKPIPVELHTCFFASAADDNLARRNRSKPIFDNLEANVRKSWSARKARIRIFQWSIVDSGDRFHERFVSTDCATIEFGGGLDTGSGSEKTSVKLMSKSAHDELSNAYKTDSDVYELLRFIDL